ncbi:TPA: YajQ family cyclic di-GMP-binding protein [Candidatus Saccharibacteria bacterium]|nr:YajQ family cyclic di-GMP-binding protein [Candidatus Saccharibacteria bacterium]HRK41043.1 YajQ family cyclic di-GMP-binding protein [Candidatus Saccharibacteria bacterium]
MANFSFDIVSEYDKAEMNNVFMQASRELSNRYDLKGTPANLEWLGDKDGFVVTAGNDMHLEAIIDIVRRNLINRNQSTKVLDLSRTPVTANLKVTQEIPFVAGLNSDRAKSVSKTVRDAFPKVKPQIQGDAVRVSSSSKDELQKVMQLLREQDFDFPLSFTNYR